MSLNVLLYKGTILKVTGNTNGSVNQYTICRGHSRSLIVTPLSSTVL